ncbi:MAG: hypothetical protein Q8Q01_05105 [archaeon]|nr:hypothetical protein [archaeon]
MTSKFFTREIRKRRVISTYDDDIALNYIAIEKLTESVMNFIFVKKLPTGKIWITDRDVNGVKDVNIDYNYPKAVSNLFVNPDQTLQYIEIGAGLGEFIPKLVDAQVKKRPIIIDPAPYETMQEMLEYILPEIEIEAHYERCLELVKRAKLMQDSKKVNLINLTLKDALDQHPEIREVGDILVDNYGGVIWSTTESGNKLEDIFFLEGLLLREGGLLYTQEHSLIKKNGELKFK